MARLSKINRQAGDRDALVRQHADVNAVDTDGRMALDAARAQKFEHVTAFFVEHGARAGTTK